MRKDDRLAHVFPMRVVTIFDFKSRGRTENYSRKRKKFGEFRVYQKAPLSCSENSTASMPTLLATVRKYYTCVARTFFS